MRPRTADAVRAAAARDPLALEAVLAKKPDINAPLDEYRQTALFIVLEGESTPEQNMLRCAKLLIASGADVNAKAYDRGSTVLHSLASPWKKLSDEHLVDVVAQSGTRATHIDRAEVEQAFLIRRALEMESAAQAAERMTEAHADALNDLLLQHARAIERRRFAEAIATDDRFHRYIADISNLDRLWRAIDISKAHLDRCRHVMLPRQGQGEATLEQHRNIIRALNSHDAERARRAMADHLEAAYSSTIRAIEAGEIKSR